MDNISDLPQLLTKTSVTADPVPADHARKGKEMAPEKNQRQVKLPSDSKIPSGMDDLDGDDDDLRQLKDPIPEDLADKAQPKVKLPSSSSDPIKAGMNDIDIDIDKDDELPQLGDPASLPSSNHPIRTGGMADLVLEGYHGFRFELLPGGRFRAEMQAPPGSMFGAMSLEGPLFGPPFLGEDEDEE